MPFETRAGAAVGAAPAPVHRAGVIRNPGKHRIAHPARRRRARDAGAAHGAEVRAPTLRRRSTSTSTRPVSGSVSTLGVCEQLATASSAAAAKTSRIPPSPACAVTPVQLRALRTRCISRAVCPPPLQPPLELFLVPDEWGSCDGNSDTPSSCKKPLCLVVASRIVFSRFSNSA
jgi:hypothetical protein